MPNHLHLFVYTANEEEIINNIIGETKRFMAYESVTSHEKAKKKKHNVFRPSEDIRKIVTEKFIRQKLNYIHRNPISGKWKLVEDYLDYIHSSAQFYDLGEKGIYNVYHYQELLENLTRWRIFQQEKSILM